MPVGSFEDDDITHVGGDINPVRDLDIIGDELRYKDIEFVENAISKMEKTALRGDKKSKPEYDTLKNLLKEEKTPHFGLADWNACRD
ncbi:Uncharacterised protein g1775 [Pycnogonum litorale]